MSFKKLSKKSTKQNLALPAAKNKTVLNFVQKNTDLEPKSRNPRGGDVYETSRSKPIQKCEQI